VLSVALVAESLSHPERRAQALSNDLLVLQLGLDTHVEVAVFDMESYRPSINRDWSEQRPADVVQIIRCPFWRNAANVSRGDDLRRVLSTFGGGLLNQLEIYDLQRSGFLHMTVARNDISANQHRALGDIIPRSQKGNIIVELSDLPNSATSGGKSIKAKIDCHPIPPAM